MSKKPLIVIALVVLALSAIGVMAQDDGPGVINVTLPDGSVAPVFTDGRLNAFDIAAPVVVYYTTENGTIANANFASSYLPSNFAVNGNSNDSAGTGIGSGSSGVNASTGNDAGNNANAIQTSTGSTLSGIQLLGIDRSTGNGSLVLEASVDDLFGLVNGQQSTISENGYTLNYSPQSNWFWVSAPADFEGKVYTFAWENTLFPTAQQNAQASAQPSVQASAQATAQPTSQATSQPTAQPTAQPTTAP
jgi:hypothetical protein